LAQVNEMLLDHEPRLRNWIFTVRAEAGELNEENKNLKAKLRD
jgi:hypothetical protein